VPMSLAFRSGESVWPRSPEELRDRFPGLGDSQLIFQSLAVIPLSVGARPFGAIALSFEARREFDTEERSFLLAAAQQAANTIERARLYESERLANERLAFIASATQLLSSSLDADTTLRQLADLAVENVADWCGVELVDEDGGLRNVATAHKDSAKVRLADELRERYPVDPEGETGVPHVIRTGVSEIWPEVPDELLVENAIDDEHLQIIRELGIGSAMVVPLKARGSVLGALTLVASDSERRYGDADLELAEELARRAALAVDNAMMFRREHEAAVTLQRSLLPHSLPEIEGLEFAAVYEPAAPGLEVGGDWYEVVTLDDGTVGLTIGDIAGRGIAAAAVMGRVRPALRAYVLDGHTPAEAMERLDRLMRESDASQMTTVLHLHFDPTAGAIEYVRAGHPPALLRLPDGSVEKLAGEGTPPLGVLDAIEYRTHHATMPPGSLLLLYTDGLIERRDDDVDAGLERLRAALAEAPSGAADCLRWLSERFSTDAIPDDVAMLAMATAPSSAV
jgi:serine phosphatase RsbU (regulator of sigma subunit)